MVKSHTNTSSKQYAHIRETEYTKDTASGALDGITIFRFAHMSKKTNSGGVEAYLSQLNNRILKRNRMRILQLYLVPDDEPCNIEIENIGQGELVWIPSFYKANRQITKAWNIWGRLMRRIDPRFLICHDVLLSSLSIYQPSLAVFHWISEDSKIVIRHLNNNKVPFVVVNHFQNARLNRRCIRSQISKARAIGGVSSIDVPGFVGSQFINLSDGVDTNFFHPGKVVSRESEIRAPLILLPSRITEGKGHIDALNALCLLLRKGVNVDLVFAGITQSPVLMDNLQRIISEEGLQERVIFAGDLSPEELRDWYAASSLVLLPSYSEGLGKVLLEAQAMERPVVAYNVGGVPEAIRHSETGYLVKKGDIEELAVRLKELIEEPDIRREMGERGRKFVVEQFSMESLTTRHERFYTNILSPSE
jgi:glycosyltransferase involved in cell wall biosynthesis